MPRRGPYRLLPLLAYGMNNLPIYSFVIVHGNVSEADGVFHPGGEFRGDDAGLC